MTATSEATAPSALNFDQLLGKTAPEKDHVICTDGAARVRLLQAEVDLAEAQRRFQQEKSYIAEATPPGMPPARPDPKYLAAVVEAERAVEAAQDAARLHSLTLHLKGLGQHEYDELMSVPGHEPTAKQLGEWEEAKAALPAEALRMAPPKPAYNPDEFQPALVAACITNMKMTKEQAKQLKDSPGWNSRDWLDLFYACQDVCAIGGHVDLGKGSKSTNNSKPNSQSAAPPSSPTPSS